MENHQKEVQKNDHQIIYMLHLLATFGQVNSLKVNTLCVSLFRWFKFVLRIPHTLNNRGTPKKKLRKNDHRAMNLEFHLLAIFEQVDTLKVNSRCFPIFRWFKFILRIWYGSNTNLNHRKRGKQSMYTKSKYCPSVDLRSAQNARMWESRRGQKLCANVFIQFFVTTIIRIGCITTSRSAADNHEARGQTRAATDGHSYCRCHVTVCKFSFVRHDILSTPSWHCFQHVE